MYGDRLPGLFVCFAHKKAQKKKDHFMCHEETIAYGISPVKHKSFEKAEKNAGIKRCRCLFPMGLRGLEPRTP